MPNGLRSLQVEWTEFLEAHARTLRRIRKRTFRVSLLNLPDTVPAEELEEERRDDEILHGFLEQHPEHAAAREMVERIVLRRQALPGHAPRVEPDEGG